MEAAGLVDQSRDRIGQLNRIGYVRRIIKKKKKKEMIKRPKRPVLAVPRVLQELFVSCRDVFKGPGTVPSPQEVHKLCHILDAMKPEDVGLSRDLQFFKPGNVIKGTPRVTYTTIYKCANFSLCIFFLPATGVIPLHNHPGMTVFSKLLLGEMHIKSYDWVDPHNNSPNLMRLAKLKADSVFKAPCDPSVLYPTTGGNIHAFTAITPCAVLDVLGPPYSKLDGRDCSYYKEHPYAAFSSSDSDIIDDHGKEKENMADDHQKIILKLEDHLNITSTSASDQNTTYGWLEEIEMPENSQMDGIEYLGPQVIETI